MAEKKESDIVDLHIKITRRFREQIGEVAKMDDGRTKHAFIRDAIRERMDRIYEREARNPGHSGFRPEGISGGRHYNVPEIMDAKAWRERDAREAQP
jgi:hypothetical protein